MTLGNILGSDALTELRSLARRAGILGPLGRLRRLMSRLRGRDAYEDAFDRELRSGIRPGDVVWDVGANLGLYTEPFSSLVGPIGAVHAFEPVPSCFGELSRRFASIPNVTLHNVALGATDATLSMRLSDDPLGATHSLVGESQSLGGTKIVDVAVLRGDTMVSTARAPIPHVIKIDVEGYEEEVITGLLETLKNRTCRAIYCEVHFAILDSRGNRRAPARIQKQLRQLGFAIGWADSSHLYGHRGER